MRSSLSIFTILLILLLSCKNDKPSIPDGASIEEKLFYQDYESPMYRWGYLNKEGRLIIEDQYDDARDFSEGLAAVNKDGKWGYINKQNEVVIDFQFRSAEKFSCGLAKVQHFNYSEYFIDQYGNRLFTIEGDELSTFYDCRARIFKDPYFYFINNTGSIVSDTNYLGATNFKNGYAIVETEFGCNVIDTSGTLLLDESYDKCHIPSDGMVRVNKGNETLYVNLSTGANSPLYRSGTDYHDGSAAIRKNGYLLIDRTGRTLSKSYDALQYLGEERWLYFQNGKCGLISSDGIELTYAMYDMIYRFSGNSTAYYKGDGWGVLNIDGKELTDPVFPLMWEYKNGMARAIFNGGVGFIDEKGDQLIAPHYIEVRDFSEGMARVQVLN